MKRLPRFWSILQVLARLYILSFFLVLLIGELVTELGDLQAQDLGQSAFFILILLGISILLIIRFLIPWSRELLGLIRGTVSPDQVNQEDSDESPEAFEAFTWLLLIIILGRIFVVFAGGSIDSLKQGQFEFGGCFLSAFFLALMIACFGYIARYIKAWD